MIKAHYLSKNSPEPSPVQFRPNSPHILNKSQDGLVRQAHCSTADVKRRKHSHTGSIQSALTNLAATYSPSPQGQVPLALERFTAGFGMGPGGTTPLWPPDEKGQIVFLSVLIIKMIVMTRLPFRVISSGVFKSIDRLVLLSFVAYTTSTWSLSRGGLPRISTRPSFEGGFPLRCFQRLSRPYIATQHYCWHNNWYTRGMSIPVLSY